MRFAIGPAHRHPSDRANDEGDSDGSGVYNEVLHQLSASRKLNSWVAEAMIATPNAIQTTGQGRGPFSHKVPTPAIIKAVPRLPIIVDQALAFSFA
jgi:hypothetical protein